MHCIVVDLGFGDSGKGLLTDYLVRKEHARLVVRFNGGAQAGHNVITAEGRHHTFSQFGAGTFAGADTYLSRFVVFHPTAAAVEARALATKGVSDPFSRLHVDTNCLVTTPFHQAAGRIRELARGAARHGTCGVGVGETMRWSDEPHAIRVKDFVEGSVRSKLVSVRQALSDSIEFARNSVSSEEWRFFDEPALAERWMDHAAGVASQIRVVDETFLDDACERGNVIFEAAQGVLLDPNVGFFPHVTWSTCTPANARALLKGRYAFCLGVIRTYMTRHGEGPLPTEDAALGGLLPELHNSNASWQNAFRVGWPDFALWRHALSACEEDGNGGIDAVAVTHEDAIARSNMDWQANVAGRKDTRTRYAVLDTSDVRGFYAGHLELPVSLMSRGPCATDVRS